jgi:hypothetical protein
MTSSYRPSRNRSPERGSYHGSIPRGPRERRSPRRDDHDGRKMPAQSGRRSPLYYERSSTYRPNYDLLDSPRSPHGPQRPAMDHDRNPGDATGMVQSRPLHALWLYMHPLRLDFKMNSNMYFYYINHTT